MSHLGLLSLLCLGGGDTALLLNIMRQSLNMSGHDGNFSALVCSLLTLREIHLLHQIQDRLSLLAHLSEPDLRTRSAESLLSTL